MTFRTVVAAAVVALFATSGFAQSHDGIHINDAYFRAAGASAQSGAAFMVIENHAAGDDRLIAAASDAAEKVELHTHKQNADGVMQMLHVPEGFAVPAGSSHALVRGGDHVMFLGLKPGLVQGDVVKVTLTFEKSGVMEVEIPVDNDRKPDHGAMDHSGHGAAPKAP